MLHAGSVPKIDLATWDFSVTGEVERDLTLTWEQLLELPSREVTVDIHCVTRWSRFDTTFKGVHWSELAKLASPKPSARFVIAHAEQGFTSNMPIDAIEDENALIAYEADGEPLTPDHGWPVRLVVPSRYFWKSAKWLRGLELRSTDEPGFLGAVRLPQRRELLARRALLLLVPVPAAVGGRRRGGRSRSRGHHAVRPGDLAADLTGGVLRGVDVDVRRPGE